MAGISLEEQEEWEDDEQCQPALTGNSKWARDLKTVKSMGSTAWSSPTVAGQPTAAQAIGPGVMKRRAPPAMDAKLFGVPCGAPPRGMIAVPGVWATAAAWYSWSPNWAARSLCMPDDQGAFHPTVTHSTSASTAAETWDGTDFDLAQEDDYLRMLSQQAEAVMSLLDSPPHQQTPVNLLPAASGLPNSPDNAAYGDGLWGRGDAARAQPATPRLYGAGPASVDHGIGEGREEYGWGVGRPPIELEGDVDWSAGRAVFVVQSPQQKPSLGELDLEAAEDTDVDILTLSVKNTFLEFGHWQPPTPLRKAKTAGGRLDVLGEDSDGEEFLL